MQQAKELLKKSRNLGQVCDSIAAKFNAKAGGVNRFVQNGGPEAREACEAAERTTSTANVHTAQVSRMHRQ